ncbi:pre-rRNA-processing protein esf1 [Batrachochytrium dendrobatidis]|nr:pre-rRNA-processing protein esf1 [Batrachochytrium dendrobatidis]
MTQDKNQSKQRTTEKTAKSSIKKTPQTIVSDPRFSRIHNDPRFIKPKKDASKITIDSRFSGMLSSKDFGSSGKEPKIDKYGRKKTTTHSKELQQFYKLDDADVDQHVKVFKDKLNESADLADTLNTDSDHSLDTGNDLLDQQDDASLLSESTVGSKDAIQGYDLARGEGLADSSSDEDDSDGPSVMRRNHPSNKNFDAEEAIDIGPYAEENIPIGDETRRFAIVNMDWDHVKAKDLFKVFDAFKPKAGTLCSVKIYPSEFGKKHMEDELLHGPPADIFRDADQSIDEPLVQADDGTEFNTDRLRKYQMERLRYYYAVVECDSVSTARTIFETCDGTEFESSANFFDLRYVPDSMSFDDAPTDVASDVPVSYQPAEFVTQALQHSSVKLTWDAEDNERIRVTRRKFTKEDLKDMDFKAYIASSSDEEDNLGEGKDADALRAKYHALLQGDSDNDAFGRKDEEDKEMEITFAPGLSEKAANQLERKKEIAAHKNETVFESYLRKRKEKRKARKNADATKNDSSSEEDDMADRQDDPFFQQDFGPEFEEPKKNGSLNTNKHGESEDKKNRKKLAAEKEKSRAELELLLLDENQLQSRHFDMKAVLKDDKQSKNKKYNKKKLAKKDYGEIQQDFEIDVADPRFAAVVESHQFAIDPTNPQFKKTKGMEKMLLERRKVLENSENSKTANQSTSRKVDSNETTKPFGSATGSDLLQLVETVKRKNAIATQGSQGKRRKQ